MSASIAMTPTTGATTQNLRPSFIGIVRGELFKIGHQWTTWIMAVLLIGVMIFPNFLIVTLSNVSTTLAHFPLQVLYRQAGVDLLVLRVFSGVFLIIVTARLIGMEYSGGTIRILLSRGVGRLQLLFAKLTAITLVALAVLVGGVILSAILGCIVLLIEAGNLNALQAITSGFWADTWLYVVTVMISMAVTILMAAAVTVIGRSLAVGLSVGVSWFPADNIGVIFFFLAYRLTGSNFWTLFTGDWLGPNINAMPGLLLPERAHEMLLGSRAFTPPLVPVTGGHTLLITLLYGIAFAAVAIILTWRRDVKE